MDDFLASRDAEVMPKPLQHARLQKLLAAVATDMFSSAETTRRGKDAPTRAGATGNQSAESQQPERRPRSSRRFEKLRILLAEDHHINMKVACAVLAKCGHKDVTIAKDGVEVLEKLRDVPNGLDAFDVVLMDLHMPRMGGMECVRQLRAQFPESRVPIVAVTADAVEDSREKCLNNGFTAWIVSRSGSSSSRGCWTSTRRGTPPSKRAPRGLRPRETRVDANRRRRPKE